MLLVACQSLEEEEDAAEAFGCMDELEKSGARAEFCTFDTLGEALEYAGKTGIRRVYAAGKGGVRTIKTGGNDDEQA